MEAVPCDLVFAYTLKYFPETQDKNETKSQHRCNKEEKVKLGIKVKRNDQEVRITKERKIDPKYYLWPGCQYQH